MSNKVEGEAQEKLPGFGSFGSNPGRLIELPIAADVFPSHGRTLGQYDSPGFPFLSIAQNTGTFGLACHDRHACDLRDASLDAFSCRWLAGAEL